MARYVLLKTFLVECTGSDPIDASGKFIPPKLLSTDFVFLVKAKSWIDADRMVWEARSPLTMVKRVRRTRKPEHTEAATKEPKLIWQKH